MVASSTVEWGGRGKGTIKASCTGGSVIMRGSMDLIDQAGGAVTVTDTARWNEDQSIARVTGSVAGNVAGSVGSVAGNVAGSVGSVVAEVDADVKKINAVTVAGAGTSGNKWRAA
jgi:hypothetical protein